MSIFGNFCKHYSNQQMFVVLALVGTIGGCATASVEEQKIVANKADPYERVNRKVFNFNDQLDNYVAEPVANAYKTITPDFVQTGVFNFYNNLKNINVVFNDVLQAKFTQGAEDTSRFVVNSTLGLLGVVDVAKKLGLEQNDEDFDQTLAVWGVPRGPYLVIPFLGPVTARGIPGAVFDTAANPSSYVGAPVQLMSVLNTRANAEGSLKFIDEAALDPYVFTRESFLQWRNGLATDGKSSETADFEDELGEENSSKTLADFNRKGFAGETQKFTDVSKAFTSVEQSFENTAKSFQNATDKLEKLKK